jgi:hypothetical protein
MTAVRPEVSSKKIAATASALSKQESDRLHVVLDDGSVVWDEAAKEILHLRATLDRTVTARDAYDIATFCVRHSISVPMYYKLRSKS